MYKEKYDYTKELTQEITNFIKSKIQELKYSERNPIEDEDKIKFDLNDVNYDVICVEESDWSDEGKYQYQDITYQLVSFNNNEYDYPNKDNIIDKFNLFFILPVTRSGSYFTNYYYEYDTPTICKQKTIHVSEQIIPAHDEYKMEEI